MNNMELLKKSSSTKDKKKSFKSEVEKNKKDTEKPIKSIANKETLQFDNLINKDALTCNEKVFDWLDKYLSGQEQAKRSLITIISCRDRRNKLPESELKNSIKPSHAVFRGPTGCGKSYLISKLSEYKNIPFIKTEATQYTEVGYVGRDVEMMIKDLIETSIRLVKAKHFKIIEEKVRDEVYEKIIAIIVGEEVSEKTYKEYYNKIKSGKLDDEEIEVEVEEDSQPMTMLDIPGSGSHMQMGALNMSDMINKILGKKNTKKLNTSVKEAIELLSTEETAKLLNESQMIKEAIKLAENEGIIFIDEIDKIVSNHNLSSRGEVSKEGVQRDLLPLLDGTTVNTKYGAVKTDHILFVAAGAFHATKFSDLLPELQGRFPMQVDLHSLNERHFVDILINKKHSLIRQHQEMLSIDNVTLIFTEDSIKTIAKLTATMNQEVENTGARRLRTIIDKILEDINFEAEKYSGKEFIINNEYIMNKMSKMMGEMDLRKFIL